MLKYIIQFIIGLIILLPTTHAQTNKTYIAGNIKTTDEKPATHVSIILKNTHFKTFTKSDGKFKMEVPAGEYIMIIHSIAIKTKEIPVKVLANMENNLTDIVVEETAVKLDEVVVTAQLAPQSLQNSIYKVRVINSEEIEHKAASNVQNLLNTEIGVRISNDLALGESDFEIMGMSGNNVKVLIDGIPVVDRLDKKQSLNQIDINTIERVEIVEGPMSVMYGSDALAGVINIITKKGNNGKKLSLGAKVQEETMGSEYDFFTNAGQHIQNINATYTFDNDLFTTINFSHNGFGGWQGNMSGRQKEWPSKEQYLAGINLGLKKVNYDVLYKFDYLNENILRKGDIPLNRKALDIEFLANRFTHQLQGNWQADDKLGFAFSGSYQDYQRDKRSTVVDFTTGRKMLSTSEGAQDESEYSIWFGRLTNTWQILNNLTVQPGLEYQYNQGAGDKIDSGNNSISNAAVFLSAEYSPLDWLNLRPGLRTSFNSKYDAPPVIPSINLKAKLNSTMDIRLSYAQGFRAPTLQELYYTFYHTNGGGFWIRGNPNLEAEKSNSYIGSLSWQAISNEKMILMATLSGFYNNFQDRIQMVNSVTESSTQTYYNSGKYKTTGFTLENMLAWQKLKLSLNFSYVGRYNTLYDDEKYAAQEQTQFRFSPEVSLSATYDFAKWLTANLFYKFTGARQEYQVYNDELVLGGLSSYNWADISVSSHLGSYFLISAGIKNLFDITRVDSNISETGGGHGTSTTGSSLIGCNRSFFIGISYNFEQ